MTSFRTPQTVLVRQPGERVNGRWVDGGTSPLTVWGTVQPASAGDYDQLRALMEGRRIERVVRLYTDARLAVAGESDANGDFLLWEGTQYLLIAVSPWRTTGLRHYRYLASKVLE